MAYISKADILDKSRVNLRLLNDLLQQGIYQVIELCIFKSSLKCFGQRGSDSKGNNNIVGILLGAVSTIVSMMSVLDPYAGLR